MIAVVSPELERGAVKVKSAYNAATARVTGIEPQYQDIRTIELEYGRNFAWQDEEQVSRVAIVGFDMAEQLFGKRNILGEAITLNGMPYTVVGKIRKKNQDSNYSGPDNNKIFVPFAAMSRDLPRRDAEPGALSDIIVAPKDWVVDAAAARARRADRPDRGHRLAARAERPRDSRAPPRLRSGRQAGDLDVGHLAADADVRPHDRPHEAVLHHRRHRDAGARRHRRDEHHAGRGEGADARDRRPQGARRDDRR